MIGGEAVGDGIPDALVSGKPCTRTTVGRATVPRSVTARVGPAPRTRRSDATRRVNHGRPGAPMVAVAVTSWARSPPSGPPARRPTRPSGSAAPNRRRPVARRWGCAAGAHQVVGLDGEGQATQAFRATRAEGPVCRIGSRSGGPFQALHRLVDLGGHRRPTLVVVRVDWDRTRSRASSAAVTAGRTERCQSTTRPFRLVRAISSPTRPPPGRGPRPGGPSPTSVARRRLGHRRRRGARV